MRQVLRLCPPRRAQEDDLDEIVALLANAAEVAKILQPTDPEAAAEVLRFAARLALSK